VIGQAVTIQPSVTGLKGIATYSISSGSLPAGLSLNPATGVITGVPSGPPGSYPAVIQVTDPYVSQRTGVVIELQVDTDTLIIEKRTTGGDGSFAFTSAKLGAFSLTTSNGFASRSFADLAPGTYTVAETVPAGWSLTSATCDNGDAPNAVTLAAGDIVTCTFENTELDSITIVKQTVGGDGTFDFTSAQLGAFSLTTVNGTASQSFTNLSAGTYSVSETLPNGWELGSATCDNGDTPDSITLAAGEAVTCTFANIKEDTITVVKQTTGGDGDFDFTSSQLGAFTLVTSNGTAQRSFPDLSPGTYSVAETVPDGWELSGATCSNGDDPAAITLAAGEAVVCTFENLKEDTLIIEKRTIGGDGAFAFTSDLPNASSFSLTTTNGSASRSFPDLSPGTYSIAETVPGGWDLTDATCDNGDDPSAVTLAAGETVTCSFENTLQSAVTGVIEIDTQALGGNATFAYTSPQLGSFSATTLNGFASNRFASLNPGSYAVSPVAQAAPSGWTLTNASCSDGSAPDAIDLSAGETVTCTFVYSRQGGDTTLIIAKQADGGDGTFPFTSAQLGAFNLTTNGGSASRSFTGLASGSYSVTEGETAGWQLIDARCDNGDSPDSITLNTGETVTCTFSNRLVGAGIPTLSPPALALLAILMTLMAARMRQRGRRG
jgi:uncharacterized protein (DUF2141 family)